MYIKRTQILRCPSIAVFIVNSFNSSTFRYSNKTRLIPNIKSYHGHFLYNFWQACLAVFNTLLQCTCKYFKISIFNMAVGSRLTIRKFFNLCSNVLRYPKMSTNIHVYNFLVPTPRVHRPLRTPDLTGKGLDIFLHRQLTDIDQQGRTRTREGNFRQFHSSSVS